MLNTRNFLVSICFPNKVKRQRPIIKVMLDFKTIKDSTKGELNTKKTNLLVSKNL